MLAHKYIATLRTVLSTLTLVPRPDRVPGLDGWRQRPAR